MLTNISKKFLSTNVIFAILTCINPLSASDHEEKEGYQLCALPDLSNFYYQNAELDNGPQLRGVAPVSKKWPQNITLYYYFLEGEDEQKQAVRDAFNTWKSVGINLSFKDEPNLHKSQIKIGFSRVGGSWSFVGTDALLAKGNEKNMNFGWDLTTDYGRSTALHEIGHALGLEHEHQSPFSPIEFKNEAVEQHYDKWDKKTIERNILLKLPRSECIADEWDPKSIMHYSFVKGLIDAPVEYKKGIEHNFQLSKGDKEFILKLYPPIIPLPIVPEVHYYIQNKESGKVLNFLHAHINIPCLAVSGFSHNHSEKWDSHRLFSFEKSEFDGYFYIINKRSGKVLNFLHAHKNKSRLGVIGLPHDHSEEWASHRLFRFIPN